MKQQTFAKLFDELDSDQDNIISRYCFNLNSLDKIMINIINPIIIELKQENETLNKDEFIKTMHHLFEILNMNDRNYILQYYRNKNKGKENHSRRSSLSNKSKVLSSLYERKMLRSISEISMRNNNSIDSSNYFKQNNNNSQIFDGKY
jgi:hypothetical protein